MKNTLLLFLILSFGLTSCREEAPSYRIQEPEPNVEEVLVLEEAEVMEEEALCEEGFIWDEHAAETNTLILPFEELYARKVYIIDDWGIKFEIPGQSSDYHLIRNENGDLLFSQSNDPACIQFGDLISPYLKIRDESPPDFMWVKDHEFPNFTALEFHEDYLGSTQIVSLEFQVNEQFYSASYLRFKDDSKENVQEALILGMLESLSTTEVLACRAPECIKSLAK